MLVKEKQICVDGAFGVGMTGHNKTICKENLQEVISRNASGEGRESERTGLSSYVVDISSPFLVCFTLFT